MTIHNRDKIIAAAKEAGLEFLMDQASELLGLFYAIAFEDGRQADKADAERYRWLRTHGLQRAFVSLGTDCDGDNFVNLRCEFKVTEPLDLPYEDDEGFEWEDKDFDAAIDEAIRARGDTE